MFGYSYSDCGAQALTLDDDAIGRDLGYSQCVIYECNAIGDQPGFRGVAGRAAEAAVIDCQDVNFLGVGGGESAIGIWAVALGYCTCVAVDWSVDINRSEEEWQIRALGKEKG